MNAYTMGLDKGQALKKKSKSLLHSWMLHFLAVLSSVRYLTSLKLKMVKTTLKKRVAVCVKWVTQRKHEHGTRHTEISCRCC